MADSLTMADLEALRAKAKAAGKWTALARVDHLIERLEASEEERIAPPKCPPSCTGDPWPWCCGGVPV